MGQEERLPYIVIKTCTALISLVLLVFGAMLFALFIVTLYYPVGSMTLWGLAAFALFSAATPIAWGLYHLKNWARWAFTTFAVSLTVLVIWIFSWTWGLTMLVPVLFFHIPRVRKAFTQRKEHKAD